MITATDIRQWIIDTAQDITPPKSVSGSPRNYYGLRVPTMRAYVKSVLKENADSSTDDWMKILDDLYHGNSFEERLVTGYFLARLHDLRRNLDFATLEKWLGQLEGWAEVDNTCQSCFTHKDLIARWEEWQPFLTNLAHDKNINKRRASLVLLRKSLADSPDSRFIDIAIQNINLLKHEKHKLITKAVSWILRESVKHHRPIIEKYLANNADSLPKIAIRETHKKLDTGKK